VSRIAMAMMLPEGLRSIDANRLNSGAWVSDVRRVT